VQILEFAQLTMLGEFLINNRKISFGLAIMEKIFKQVFLAVTSGS